MFGFLDVRLYERHAVRVLADIRAKGQEESSKLRFVFLHPFLQSVARRRRHAVWPADCKPVASLVRRDLERDAVFRRLVHELVNRQLGFGHVAVPPKFRELTFA